jgi:2-oxoglutarate ferredoxin oxidoreductase subunit beta
MTGGQVAPSTLIDLKTSTTPYGNPEHPFDICQLVITAGATYVSRSTTQHPRQCINFIKNAFNHKGFALVEIISQCPTYFGRKAINSGIPSEGIEWIDNNSVTIRESHKLSEEELKGKFVVGNFVNKKQPVFMGSSYYFDEEFE